MYDKNKLLPLKSQNQIWTTNKTYKHPKLNRSMLKSFNNNNSLSFCSSPIKRPISITVPYKYHTSVSPQPISITQPLNQFAVNSETNKSKILQPIEQSEQKIDQLLKQKLKLLVLLNKRRLSNKNKESAQDREIIQEMNLINSQISSSIQNVKIRMDRHSNQQLELQKDINIVEKMLAQNDTERDIIRKRYSSVCQNSTTYKSFYNSPSKSSLNINKTNSCFSFQKHTKTNINNEQLKLPFNSTSKISYKPPNSSDYEKYRYKQLKKDNSDERVVKLSSYKSSYRYLTPPKLPSQDTSRRNKSSVLDQYTPQKSISSYKQQFQSYKQQQLIDYKKLDCYRNKFNNLKMNWDSGKQSLSSEFIKDHINFEKGLGSASKLNRYTQPSVKLLLNPKGMNTPNPQVYEQKKIDMVKPKNKKLNALRVSYRQLCNKI